MRAVVIRSAQREFDCKLLESGEVIKARALGNLLKDGEIVVGDNVLVKRVDNEIYEIFQIEKRTSEIYRLLVREKRKKVIAANCDYMVIVSAVSRPEYKRGIVDRFLVRAHQWGVVPLVVFNKMDQFSDEFDLRFEAERVERVPAESFEVSSEVLNYQSQFLKNGLVQLREKLKGKRAIFLGQSGVGKSKLITALVGGEISLKSGVLGKRSGKGAHTTTWAEIVDCGDFSLIDSPGIRSFALDDIFEEDLIGYFPDIATIATQCKFSNCTHLENSKGCAFLNESETIKSRLESYLKIEEEVRSRNHWEKK